MIGTASSGKAVVCQGGTTQKHPDTLSGGKDPFQDVAQSSFSIRRHRMMLARASGEAPFKVRVLDPRRSTTPWIPTDSGK
jgi:hypothetical protein